MRPWPRALAILLAPVLLLPTLTGCLTTGDDDASTTEKPVVLASFYPLEFLASRIAGDNVTVKSATGQGVTPHGWEPTARDLARIADADLLLEQGLGFDAWVPQALESLGARAPPVVTASEGLSLLRATADHAHDEDEDHDAHANETAAHDEDGHDAHDEDHANETHTDDHDAHANETAAHDEDDHAGDAHDEDAPETTTPWNGTGAPDPHTWLDPVRFAEQARVVEHALSERFPEHAAAFAARADALVAELDTLDAAFESGLASCEARVVIVSHNAFSYLADRYGFSVLSVHGLSPTSEPDARTVARLVDAARDHDLHAVFMEELANPRVVQSIADEVNAEVLVLSPVEGLPEDARAAGGDYVTMQEQNLQNLREGMRCS